VASWSLTCACQQHSIEHGLPDTDKPSWHGKILSTRPLPRGSTGKCSLVHWHGEPNLLAPHSERQTAQIPGGACSERYTRCHKLAGSSRSQRAMQRWLPSDAQPIMASMSSPTPTKCPRCFWPAQRSSELAACHAKHPLPLQTSLHRKAAATCSAHSSRRERFRL
jgi:hypothetical protein